MCHSCLDIAHCKALKNYQQSDSQSLCASTKVVCGEIKNQQVNLCILLIISDSLGARTQDPNIKSVVLYQLS